MEPLKCDDVEPLLTPYVDGEAAADDRERVAEHLGRCRPCARRAAGEQAARHLVQLRCRSLAAPAPPGLRARCQALARGGAPARERWFAWRGLILAGATATLLLVSSLVAYGLLSDSNTLLVAGLTLDHLKCFTFSERGASLDGGDPRAIADRLQREYGWQLAIPPGVQREGLALVGARRCLSTDGRVAHVLYRHDGRPVSLFVLPAGTHDSASMSFIGHPARVWSRGSRTYVLVASESGAQVAPVARYFQAAAY